MTSEALKPIGVNRGFLFYKTKDAMIDDFLQLDPLEGDDFVRSLVFTDRTINLEQRIEDKQSVCSLVLPPSEYRNAKIEFTPNSDVLLDIEVRDPQIRNTNIVASGFPLSSKAGTFGAIRLQFESREVKPKGGNHDIRNRLMQMCTVPTPMNDAPVDEESAARRKSIILDGARKKKEIKAEIRAEIEKLEAQIRESQVREQGLLAEVDREMVEKLK